MFVSENEAALFLGITKELLYAFVKTGVKGKTLPVNVNRENNFFKREELNAWNLFLKEAWSLSSTEKPEIPSFIKEYLKVESGGKCVRCGSGHRLDNAHIIPWRESLSHHPHNLIRLCTDCHIKYDDGIISREEILKIKNEKIKRIKADILADISFKDQSFSTLPNPTKNFTGRSSELEKLHSLFNQNRFTLIEGIGGIGKTQFLLQFIKNNQIEVVWIDLDQYGTLTDLKYELGKRLGVSNLDDLATTLDREKTVLVLDGFEILWHKEQDNTVSFLKSLYTHTKETKLIITSQINFLDVEMAASVLTLTNVSQNESIEIIQKHVPSVDIRDNSIRKLIKFADGHPLTITIISGLLQFMVSPAKVSNAIEHAGAKIIQNPKYKQQNRQTSLQICLLAAYENLETNQKWLLRYLTHFPAGSKIPFLEILTKGQQQFFPNEFTLNLALSTLKQFNFIYIKEDLIGFERAHTLNPIRLFVRGKTIEESKSVFHQIKIEAYTNLMMEAIALYSNFLLSDEMEYVIARYEIELPNYLMAIQECVHSAYCKDCKKYSNSKDYLRIITGLSTGLYKFFFTRGYFHYGIYVNKQGARAHIELDEYDFAIEDLAQVAVLNWRLYNVEETKKVLQQMLNCESKANRKFAVVRQIEGELLRDGDPNAAISKFKEGIKLCENEIKVEEKLTFERKQLKSHSSANGNMAVLFSEIGRTYERNLHDENKALPYYLKGYEIQKGMKDYANMYCNSHHLGNCYSGIGDYKSAIKFYREALEGFVELGQQQYIGNSLSELGRLRVTHPELDFSFLTKELLSEGLQDIEAEIKILFKQNEKKDKDVGGNLPIEIINKLFYIIQLASFHDDGHILHDWATNFKKFIPNWAAYPLTFIMIAEIVGKVLKENTISEEEIRDLNILCFLKGLSYEHENFKPYRWLAYWLEHNGITDGAMPITLYNETKEFMLAVGMLQADEYDEFDP
ncbi:hypothetical protein GCM10011386_39120 [Parapedobacter defluvii]|uniref:HNH nuclease domain-containing protein n=1 Tax=Parapedobacter defluvii TaxID=2045106 RepID=A0ABQ1MM01_9SPHI|nr:HNH endonuclease [Parapedobacter defluvii]GGC42996.1 hypothetical protein GCM10011386_39120 [Parapedobacter defluvii]